MTKVAGSATSTMSDAPVNSSSPSPEPFEKAGNTVACDVSLVSRVEGSDTPLASAAFAASPISALPRAMPCWSAKEKRRVSISPLSMRPARSAPASACSGAQRPWRSTNPVRPTPGPTVAPGRLIPPPRPSPHCPPPLRPRASGRAAPLRRRARPSAIRPPGRLCRWQAAPRRPSRTRRVPRRPPPPP